MVRITNGKETFEVTRGAFDGIFSHQGFRVVEEENKEMVENNMEEKTENDIFVESIIEKPISEWTKEEIKKFAGIKNIDISDVRNASEARGIIKEYLENNSEE